MQRIVHISASNQPNNMHTNQNMSESILSWQVASEIKNPTGRENPLVYLSDSDQNDKSEALYANKRSNNSTQQSLKNNV